MSVSSDPGRKPVKRLGGMAEALAIASDLGFPIPPVQEDQQGVLNSLTGDKGDDLIRFLRQLTTVQRNIANLQVELQGRKEDQQGVSNSLTGDKGDDLIRVLRQLTTVQRNIANLQVELQGRKDDKNIAHLTHVSEMEKKCESLARITAILKDVIQNKDRIIARLQQPYSLDCIPVEAEYQKQFSELLLKAASDYGALTAAVADFQWCQNFKESPTIWGEMLRPIPAALASCTRFFEAMSAMRDSFATLQQFRVSNSSVPMTPSDSSGGDSKFTTPPLWREGMASSDDSVADSWRQQDVEEGHAFEESDEIIQRRLSWPSVKKGM